MACDLAGTRTQDPYIKSVLLYQLSYEIIPEFKINDYASLDESFTIFWECKNKGKTYPTKLLKKSIFPMAKRVLFIGEHYTISLNIIKKVLRVHKLIFAGIYLHNRSLLHALYNTYIGYRSKRLSHRRH